MARDKLQGLYASLKTSVSSREGEGSDSSRKKTPLAASSDSHTSESPEAVPPVESGSQLENVEQLIKTMFGTCVGALHNIGGDTESSRPSRRRDRDLRSYSSRSPERSSSRRRRSKEHAASADDEEDSYGDRDDGKKSRRNHDSERKLREERTDATKAVNKDSNKQKAKKVIDSSPVGHVRVESTILPFQDEDNTGGSADADGCYSFDDGISAISAHTLDEMARDKTRRSELSQKIALTLGGTAAGFEAPAFNGIEDDPEDNMVDENGDKLGEAMKSFPMTKGRSNTTWKSFGTNTTEDSEQTNDFENLFKVEEKSFWAAEIAKDEKDAKIRSQTPSAKSISESTAENTPTTSVTDAFDPFDIKDPYDDLLKDITDLTPPQGKKKSYKKYKKSPEELQEEIQARSMANVLALRQQAVQYGEI
eukprot:CAMPEP_0198286608 /NCGR_PEP_ID=MMETSP1449-20131203/5654_1 /TAXON_ID=420275 /ORGANISM="Attheya septentrionalis, Strain CCMP2084" /LENGTH=421 /DNA_ID=CAMNT_0043984393 /DNA_START=238 /DNA_END=1503 /DNA_ORIENTATION=-